MGPKRDGSGAPKLAVFLGDQLDPAYVKTLGLRKDRDVILMMEVEEESRHVASHVQRTILFLSAMRHFAARLRKSGWTVDYIELDDPVNTQSFETELRRAVGRHEPEEVCGIHPGEWRVLRLLERACDEAGVPYRCEEDPHFLCSLETFHDWAEGRKSFILEFFYRKMRKELDILMDGNEPEGGEWNFDKENRETFRQAPETPEPARFDPDTITHQVIELVRRQMPDLPGRIEHFHWPVTREQAREALDRFVADRLPHFGTYQDAMWTDQHALYHSQLSSSLNLKLLNPREVCDAVLGAYESGHAPINSVEGYIRQIIGWREFIRGVYWQQGESYPERNSMQQYGGLPWFYWDGETDMRCMSEALDSVLSDAYGHHIERLMVTGNFALISGVHPGEITAWYLGMYADAVDWVTTPNTLGMAMFSDGGVVGTKPYAASGKYIKRMSNFCKHCTYDVNQRTGEDACPFNVFYWDFLIRNRERFKDNNRMAMVLKNVERLKKEDRVEITRSAKSLREKFGIGDPAKAK